jgi:hypothetical protein
MNYVIGRNCRFLQGPKTNPFSVKRIREKLEAGKEHMETFLNYRRDGSPFMNLLMVAPLYDSRGTVRYFIGAQVDVSGLVKECTGLESFERLVSRKDLGEEQYVDEINGERNDKDEFQELSEMFNMRELETVRKHGGHIHHVQQEDHEPGGVSNWHKPRILIREESASIDGDKSVTQPSGLSRSGRLSGVYENYLLVRPYPNLRILFASPSLRVPGILQSNFMAKIGGSARVQNGITQAFADGQGITAKVRWISKPGADGRVRWIHCTPLLGSNGAVGVWMVVIVDEESDAPARGRDAPPVDSRLRRASSPHYYRRKNDDSMSIAPSVAMRTAADEISLLGGVKEERLMRGTSSPVPFLATGRVDEEVVDDTHGTVYSLHLEDS